MVGVLSLSCESKVKEKISFSLLEEKVLEEIPGASGIAVFQGSIYVVGDNSPFLYRLDLQGQLSSKTTIYNIENFIEGEIQKNIKPDFEAMELVQNENGRELIIFGSGSKSPERDIFLKLLLDPKPQVESYSLGAFYDMLRGFKIMEGVELNIEAVAIAENDLLLLNRDENMIFRFNYRKFLNFINNGEKMPVPEIISVDLPEISGIEAGFSGATYLREKKVLFLTASVEDTPNAYEDGEVLGSFIGVVPLDEIGDAGAYKFALLSDGNFPMQIKVESVSVSEVISEKEVRLFLVTDSDGEVSNLVKGSLKW